MRILVSNDDGLGAPGLTTLVDELKRIERVEVWVVCPDRDRSCCGHGLTLNAALSLEEVNDKTYRTNGLPADCILLGLSHILKESRPDLIISGINNGANLGQDIYYSGTVAAAREGAFNDIPSFAISTTIDYLNPPRDVYYNSAAKFIRQTVERGWYKEIPKFSLLNINVPNLPLEKIKGTLVTKTGFRHYSKNIREESGEFWLKGECLDHLLVGGSDSEAISENLISVNPINLLHHETDIDKKWTKLVDRLNDYY